MRSIAAIFSILLASSVFAQNRPVKGNFIGFFPECASFINFVETPSRPVLTGETFTLIAHAGSFGNLKPESYKWFRGEVGDVSGGVVGTGPSITISETDTTTYWLRVTADCGGPATSQVTVPLEKGACAGKPEQLCVANNRYRVTVDAVDPKGNVAQGVALYQTNSVGYFSLPAFTGDVAVPEVVVKVLEPAGANPWIFYSGLTNLDYTIHVTDTATGRDFNTYHVAAPPVGSEKSVGNFDVAGATSEQCADVVVQTSLAASPASCANGDGQLCLLNRFLITMKAHDNPSRSAAEGDGAAIPATQRFGFFSVPALSNDRRNVEAFVKMIDANASFGKYWLFFGGLSDFELTVTATDTVTGAQKIYTKPAGSTCGINDTSAF